MRAALFSPQLEQFEPYRQAECTYFLLASKVPSLYLSRQYWHDDLLAPQGTQPFSENTH